MTNAIISFPSLGRCRSSPFMHVTKSPSSTFLASSLIARDYCTTTSSSKR